MIGISPMATPRRLRYGVRVDAIVIVDLQQAFAVPAEVVRKIEARARDFSRRIFTQFVNPPGSLFRCKLQRYSCAPDSADCRLLITPAPGDVVLVKTGYGLNAGQIRQLKELGLRKVLVCGVDTDACVLGVIFSLFDEGIDCSVDPELCWSSTGLQSPALAVIREQFGTPQDL
jgi:nicotinamidase-related amidase